MNFRDKLKFFQPKSDKKKCRKNRAEIKIIQ